MGSTYQHQEPDPAYNGSGINKANPHSQDNCSRRESDRGSEDNPRKWRDHSTDIWKTTWHREKRSSQENFWKLKQTKPDKTPEKHYAKTDEDREGG